MSDNQRLGLILTLSFYNRSISFFTLPEMLVSLKQKIKNQQIFIVNRIKLPLHFREILVFPSCEVKGNIGQVFFYYSSGTMRERAKC